MFLPYCLELQEDGSYVVVNRRYKPVGLTMTEWVSYDVYPCKIRFKRALSSAQISALDCKGRTDRERIYLYDDGSIPTDSASKWRAYSERLERLAGYAIEH